jgi:hypothetical protein
MDRMLPTETAILLELQFVRSVSLVLGRRVVALFTLGAAKSHDITHCLILGALPGSGRAPVLDKNSGNSDIIRQYR